ncbi:MAG: hypothetical protein DMF72_08800 [Acidobacteria bacterium]|nr:MAG: hypothetical protein DMF72_08800 [Acidobacteriota bacterium]
MLNHNRVILLFLVVLTVACVAVLALRAQRQTRSRAQEQYDPSNTPTTDYDKPEPSDPEKRKLRQIRGNRFKLKDKNVDSKRFEVTEERQSGFGAFEIHAKPEPAIPAAQSNAIVIGEVTDAEAFLSTDKTSIYSEFTVKIGEVLKGISPTVFPGAPITAIRGGGAVRFPSGKVVWEAFNGKPFPRIGRRYVFFLKYDAEARDFSILTAYELSDGRISPLDGLYTTGEVVPQLADHQKFSGVDETTFLATVRQAIAQAGGTMLEGAK